ncbi:hypothetical protein STEG23_037520 [Scotinomys teguina]
MVTASVGAKLELGKTVAKRLEQDAVGDVYTYQKSHDFSKALHTHNVALKNQAFNATMFSDIPNPNCDSRPLKLPSYLDVDIEVLLTNARVTGIPCCAFDLPI